MKNNFQVLAPNKVDFHYNCGIDEQSFSQLYYCVKPTPKDIIDYFNYYFRPVRSRGAGYSGAAIVFSDNRDCGHPMYEALSQVATKISLGRNTNSGNNIYMWVLSRNSIANYERKKNNSKKSKSKSTPKKGSGKKAK